MSIFLGLGNYTHCTAACLLTVERGVCDLLPTNRELSIWLAGASRIRVLVGHATNSLALVFPTLAEGLCLTWVVTAEGP